MQALGQVALEHAPFVAFLAPAVFQAREIRALHVGRQARIGHAQASRSAAQHGFHKPRHVRVRVIRGVPRDLVAWGQVHNRTGLHFLGDFVVVLVRRGRGSVPLLFQEHHGGRAIVGGGQGRFLVFVQHVEPTQGGVGLGDAKSLAGFGVTQNVDHLVRRNPNAGPRAAGVGLEGVAVEEIEGQGPPEFVELHAAVDVVSALERLHKVQVQEVNRQGLHLIAEIPEPAAAPFAQNEIAFAGQHCGRHLFDLPPGQAAAWGAGSPAAPFRPGRFHGGICKAIRLAVRVRRGGLQGNPVPSDNVAADHHFIGFQVVHVLRSEPRVVDQSAQVLADLLAGRGPQEGGPEPVDQAARLGRLEPADLVFVGGGHGGRCGPVSQHPVANLEAALSVCHARTSICGHGDQGPCQRPGDPRPGPRPCSGRAACAGPRGELVSGRGPRLNRTPRPW